MEAFCRWRSTDVAGDGGIQMANTGDSGQVLLIGAMMNRLGLERAGGVLPKYALRYAAARRNCESCASKSACRMWLDAHAVAPFAPPFCANGDALFELQYDQHRLA